MEKADKGDYHPPAHRGHPHAACRERSSRERSGDLVQTAPRPSRPDHVTAPNRLTRSHSGPEAVHKAKTAAWTASYFF